MRRGQRTRTSLHSRRLTIYQVTPGLALPATRCMVPTAARWLGHLISVQATWNAEGGCLAAMCTNCRSEEQSLAGEEGGVGELITRMRGDRTSSRSRVMWLRAAASSIIRQKSKP